MKRIATSHSQITSLYQNPTITLYLMYFAKCTFTFLKFIINILNKTSCIKNKRKQELKLAANLLSDISIDLALNVHFGKKLR